MRIPVLSLLLIVCVSCHSVKIKNECYQTSVSQTELGSIGQPHKSLAQKNSFAMRTVPQLQNRVRLSANIVPFTKDIDKIYRSKSEFNQSQAKITYIDSLPKKPEMVTFRVIDITGLVSELNADYNKETFQLLTNNSKAKIVTSVAVSLSPESMEKIRQADAYYLENRENSKYSIALYKQAKKTETIDIGSSTVIAYRLSSLCWGLSDRGKWYIADLYEGQGKCRKPMKKKVTAKAKSKSLYDM